METFCGVRCQLQRAGQGDGVILLHGWGQDMAGLFVGMLLGALIAPQSETAGSAIGGVIGLAAALIGLTVTEKKRSESGEYAPKLLRVISAADALKN